MFCAGLAHGMRCALSLVGAMSRVEGGSPPPLQQFVVQAVQEDPRLGTQSVPGRLLLVRAHNSARAPGGSHFSLARPTSSACFEQHARPLPQGGGLQFFRRLLITFAPQIRHSGAARHTILRIPEHADHRFRRMPITDSDSCRSPIPSMPIAERLSSFRPS